MFGYNDMNTYVPNPFAVDEMINMSGAGRKPKGKKLNFIENERRKTRGTAEMWKAIANEQPRYELYGSGMDDEDMDGAVFFD